MIYDTLAFIIGILSVTAALALVLRGIVEKHGNEDPKPPPDHWPEYRPRDRRWGITL